MECEARTLTIDDEVAAAVCYRRIGDTTQFLLVRTKGGRYGTAPKGIDRAEYRVAAFLFEVTRECLPHESGREPTWYMPDEARARLGAGRREREYAREQRSVIDAALAALDHR